MRCAGVLAIVALAACAAAGCGGGPDSGDARDGGSIVVGVPSSPDSLDPALASEPAALQMVWQAYTPLLTYRHAEGRRGTELAPALAARMPELSQDGLTYSLILRRGLRFSDGRPLRARDFKRSLERAVLLNPRARALFSGVTGMAAHLARRRGISGIRSDDRARTVKIELSRSEPGFPNALASTWAAPVPAGTPVRELRRRPPAGIGPYRLVRRRGRAVLVRRTGFALPNVPDGNVDEIRMRTVPDAARAARSAISGAIDVSEGRPPLSLLPDVRSRYKGRYEEHSTLGVLYVALDVRRRPFTDRRLRRAVGESLDTAALVRLLDGFMDPSCNMIPPQVLGHEDLDPCPFGQREGTPDLEGARRTAERATRGRARVLVAPGQGPDSGPMARFVAASLTKVGLRARVARGAGQRRRAGVRMLVRRPDEPLPAGYLSVDASPGVAARIAMAQEETGEDETVKAWRDLDRAVVGAARVVPFGVQRTGVLFSERLDVTNCSRYQPVYGLDLASLCLR